MRLLEFDEIDSTNLEARRMAAMGDSGPVWIVAARQLNGKGRRGREWVSQSGNLFCTGLFPYKGTRGSAAQLSFAAALAVYGTVAYFRPDANVKIKWPNDVLMNGAKVSGILLESGGEKSQSWIAVGMGINIVSAPADTPYPATFLGAGLPTTAPLLVANIRAKLFHLFEHWMDVHHRLGFAPLRTAWLQHAQGIGGVVKAKLPNKTIIGTAIGMDLNGALELKTETGQTVKIHAGDVFFL